MTDMESILATAPVRRAIDAALASWADQADANRVRAEVQRAGGPHRTRWAELGEPADALASTLEEIAFDTKQAPEASARLDAATMIRVRAGEVARRGGPFTWKLPVLFGACAALVVYAAAELL